eukprot:2796357-Rhodomonas_salina.1
MKDCGFFSRSCRTRLRSPTPAVSTSHSVSGRSARPVACPWRVRRDYDPRSDLQTGQAVALADGRGENEDAGCKAYLSHK